MPLVTSLAALVLVLIVAIAGCRLYQLFNIIGFLFFIVSIDDYLNFFHSSIIISSIH